MKYRLLGCLALVLLGVGGCLWDDPNPSSNRNSRIPPRDQLPKASLDATTRVDSLGRQILAANPDLTIRPMFLAIGVPAVTTFHRGTAELYVSDGLINKCKTDGELAAILCAELGKMVAEAHLDGPQRLPPGRDLPLAPRIGNDVGRDSPDMTSRAELANYEKNNPRPRGTALPSPNSDPDVLARTYLTKAGFTVDDLVKAGPLLRVAESNPLYERQLSPARGDNTGIPR